MHKKNLEISRESSKVTGDRSLESISYVNLGSTYRDLGDYNKAIEFTEKALEIAKECKNRAVELTCYGNLGNAYRDLGDYNTDVLSFIKKLCK